MNWKALLTVEAAAVAAATIYILWVCFHHVS